MSFSHFYVIMQRGFYALIIRWYKMIRLELTWLGEQHILTVFWEEH